MFERGGAGKVLDSGGGQSRGQIKGREGQNKMGWLVGIEG